MWVFLHQNHELPDTEAWAVCSCRDPPLSSPSDTWCSSPLQIWHANRGAGPSLSLNSLSLPMQTSKSIENRRSKPNQTWALRNTYAFWLIFRLSKKDNRATYVDLPREHVDIFSDYYLLVQLVTFCFNRLPKDEVKSSWQFWLKHYMLHIFILYLSHKISPVNKDLWFSWTKYLGDYKTIIILLLKYNKKYLSFRPSSFSLLSWIS